MSESLITKKAIAQSVKELMKKEDLRKISVSDIVKKCGVNRQTFYYHFKDKYDLVNWIYYNEVVSAVSSQKTFHDWSDVMLDILSTMKREKCFYRNAFNVTGQNAFQDYFFNLTKSLLIEIIGEMEDGKGIRENDKNFIAEFYTYGLVGIVIQWARNGMKEQPKELVDKLKYFIDDSKQFTAARYLGKLTGESGGSDRR
ncbi:dihydroxyacetone kinase transcriptional activator DhaS [Caproiciproducens sp. NJN-50]|uniref:dihydroxyacetone kinase transcriptional activator DhaS n=1 Tax=Acutalibacteraceae TaxID=3082771 RepID=UPI000FFE0B7E|nr:MULTISPECIES: dihydroxyacetone kinase transcriptional activator DhaS [Acutalibacteraceae]QAT49854.1 dihydroxyacetone kinase transcriptional activator DhaS [Caproiciproducens sp. NJN-50]